MPPKKSLHSNRFMQTKNQHFRSPDIELCDECKKLGYCKESTSTHMQESYEMATSVQVNRPFDLKYYTAKIPLRVNGNEIFSQYTREHLQTAYDAFHQDDFETALLHFKSVEPGGNYSQSDYFLALTYFMLGNYEMANAHMQACTDRSFYKAEDFTSFLDECSRRSVTGRTREVQSIVAKEYSCVTV